MDQCGGRDAGVMRPEVVAVRCTADRLDGCGPVSWSRGPMSRCCGSMGWSWRRDRCWCWGWSGCWGRLGGAGLLHESVQGW